MVALFVLQTRFLTLHAYLLSLLIFHPHLHRSHPLPHLISTFFSPSYFHPTSFFTLFYSFLFFSGIRSRVSWRLSLRGRKVRWERQYIQPLLLLPLSYQEYVEGRARTAGTVLTGVCPYLQVCAVSDIFMSYFIWIYICVEVVLSFVCLPLCLWLSFYLAVCASLNMSMRLSRWISNVSQVQPALSYCILPYLIQS
jgi:hypothetical protein